MVRFNKDLGCLETNQTRSEKSHLTSSLRLSSNSAFRVQLNAAGLERLQLDVFSRPHLVVVIRALDFPPRTIQFCNSRSVQACPSTLMSRKLITASRKGEKKLSHNWRYLGVSLSVSPSNGQGSLAEAQWPRKSPPWQRQGAAPWTRLAATHSLARTSSSLNCLCLSFLHYKMGESWERCPGWSFSIWGFILTVVVSPNSKCNYLYFFSCSFDYHS